MKRTFREPAAHWTVETLLEACPGAARVFTRRGMACVGCTMARFETLADVAREYRVDLMSLLEELRSVRCDGKHRERP